MPINEECTELADASGPLVCHRPIGHDGLHYDGQDNISWKVGQPDE